MQTTNDGWSPLCVASYQGKAQVIKLLLKQQGWIEREVSFGMRPLLLAIQEGHSDVAELLQRAGADVIKPNDLGETALMLACQQGNIVMVECLLRSGACSDQEIMKNQTAFSESLRYVLGNANLSHTWHCETDTIFIK